MGAKSRRRRAHGRFRHSRHNPWVLPVHLHPSRQASLRANLVVLGNLPSEPVGPKVLLGTITTETRMDRLFPIALGLSRGAMVPRARTRAHRTLISF